MSVRRALQASRAALLCALVLAGPVLAAVSAGAAALVAVPPLAGHVTDLTATLGAAQRAELEGKLAAFEARKGSQLAVLIVETTQPEPIEAYALRVAEQWKLGRRKVDDGAILVVATQDRALRIEVGYGLEGVLNDATCKRLIDEVIVPRLRRQDLAGGVAEGVDRLIGLVDGEPLPAAPPRDVPQDVGELPRSLPFVLMAALAVGAALRAVLGRLGGAAATGVLAGLATWWFAGALWMALGAGVAAMLLTLFGGLGLLARGALGGGRGGYGGSGGGRGGYGGGGGGFGGGGASGRW